MAKQIRISETVEGVQAPPLIVATDAAALDRLHSGGFLATNGRWGINAAPYSADDVCYPQCAEAMELRAMWYGVRLFPLGTVLTLLTDSHNSMLQIERWRQGDTELPRWYSTRPRGGQHPRRPTLRTLQERITTDTAHITVRHVGRERDPLNAAADALAGIGLNFLRKRYDSAEARRRGASLVASFLLSYAQTLES